MLDRLSPREIALIGVLILVALLAGVYKFQLQPQLSEYKALRQELADKRSQLQQAEQTISREKQELLQYEQSVKQLGSYNQSLAGDFRDGSAVVLLGSKSAGAEVAINNLEPLGIIEKEGYLELPLKLELYGNYVNVVEYITQLEKLPNLVEIRNLKVTAEQPPADNKRENDNENKPENEPENQPADGAAAKPLPQAETVVFTEPKIKALLDLVIYSAPSPNAGLTTEQEKMKAWGIGRPNPFEKPEKVSPYPGF